MPADTTHTRVQKTVLARLKKVLKDSQNGMPVVELIDKLLTESLEQIERDKPQAGPLPTVELLRRQRGLGSVDVLRETVENKKDLDSVVRELSGKVEELSGKYSTLEDLAAKYAELLKGKTVYIDSGGSVPRQASGRQAGKK